MKTTLFILIAMITIFSSCKEKEEPVDPCTNGFLDIGESGIDCGGNCPACIPNEPSSMYLEYNNVPFSYTSKSLIYENNNWTLKVSNDTISFQFNLGSDGSIGNYSMNPTGCIAVKNGIYYTNSGNGNYAISSHNLSSKKMSGFFSANFWRTGFTDTLKVRNGQFDYMPY